VKLVEQILSWNTDEFTVLKWFARPSTLASFALLSGSSLAGCRRDTNSEGKEVIYLSDFELRVGCLIGGANLNTPMELM
jgi:hypothetical protein